MKKKQTRTLMEKLEGISFLESLSLTPDTIEAIEDAIDNPEEAHILKNWSELGL